MARDVTGTNSLYPSYLLNSFRGGVFEPENDTLRMGLARAGYVPDNAHNELADITDEASGNGYNRQTLQNVTLVIEDGWLKLTFDSPQFMPAGGNIPCKYWFIFDDTAPGDPLVAHGQVDGSTEDEITLVDGLPLTVGVNELGLFRLPT